MVTRNLSSLIAQLIISIIIFLYLFPTSAYSQVKSEQIMEKAKSIYQKVERIQIDSTKAVPSVVRGILAYNVNLKDDRQVQNFIQKSAELFKINNQNDDFRRLKVTTDELGMTHLKLHQQYKGIPVWGSELILHTSSSNEVREISGRFVPNLNIDVNHVLSPKRALDIALTDLGPAEYRWLNPEQEKIIKEVYGDETRSWKPVPELMIAPVNGDFNKGEYRLVWKMIIAVDGAKLGNYVYFIDAKNGKVINKFNSMPNAVGSGVSNYNGTVTVYSKWATNIYQMIDTIRSIKTYNANNTTTNPGTILTDSDNYWNSNNDAVDAHWGLGKVYDFYKNVFNRNSFNGSGAEIIGTVNYLFDYGGGVTSRNNAAWNGAQMLFGSGDGNNFSSVTSLDVTGHEFTHAITDYTANLIYQGESGALNEAISDIFGTAIEFYATPAKANWLLGEECYTPGTAGDALRYMNNPNSGQQPDTYQGTYWASTSGGDYGGVHTNSGVLNYCFYLMTEGGSGTNDNGDPFNVTGIGLTKTRAIAYRALTTYFAPSDYYSNARERFLSAVSDLYGSSSAEYRTVSDAFGAVGIGVRYIAKNNFNAGIIKINGYTTNSGTNFFATGGNNQTLEAIQQYYTPYNYVWNTTVSIWKKQSAGGAITDIPGATNVSYNFTATQSDHNATYIADLKKVYNVTRNDQSLESGNTFNSVNVQIIEGNSLLAPSPQTVGGITYSFIDWSDGLTQNPRVITSPSSPLVARFKALRYSNDATAFSNNSQRKLIETKTGTTTWLHQVYASAGHVWIEHSSNGGSTWVLGNNGQPLDGTTGGKNPSIAYTYYSWSDLTPKIATKS